ncbi:MAG: SDR family NAD(P)-dependent oxidoreductase [Alphaproteobacteria bacterium]|nr:SDR family NAD(P)-dependent oxidoreductase [Alphaproteobacteria bacterium]
MTAPPARRVVILGAQSAIAEACARRFAAESASLVIVGRDLGRLNEIANDLAARGAAQVHAAALDLAAEQRPAERFLEWGHRIGGVTHVLIAFGTLGDQTRMESDVDAARLALETNFTAAALWALAAADLFERQRSGVLVAIGSVAGDRGRRSNYVYGAAKAGLGVLMQGIAHRLHHAGDARAVLIKPGLVETPMTGHMDVSGRLWARPEEIAAIIHRAGAKGGPVVYAPARWRWIMLAIRALPAFVMHHTRL